MFHFPTFPPLALCVQARVTGHDSSWVSPFGHPRITARLPTPQGLSQAPTSFIGSWCQGIHHVPFIACLNNVKTTQLQKTSTPTPPHTHQPPHPPKAGTTISNDEESSRGYTYLQPPPANQTGDDRCSRPLSRSQTTTPPTPHTHHQADTRQRRNHRTEQPHTPTHRTTPRTGHHTADKRCLILQDPTVCHHPTTPQTQDPGSTPTPPPSPKEEQKTRIVLRASTHQAAKRFIDDSTSEHHHAPPHER